ncbi:MAG: carbohydrate kinase [Caulobacter sp.]|nr:carbohydrate kinase [Caulobacter sp.]
MTSAPVVVIGEALIDLTPGTGGGLQPHVGGGPFNVARAIGRMGRAVAFVGGVSTDRFGASLAAALEADGVSLHPGLRDPRLTALALAELDGQGQAAYRFYVAGTATEGLTADLALACAPADVSAIYAGGLGLVLEPLAAASEALVASRAGRALVFVDPNVRPAGIPDMAAFRARLNRVLASTEVVKVSDADLEILAPGAPAESAAEALLGQGPKLVLLTLGGKGAVAFGAFGRIAVSAPPVRVVDTIGAGDSFSGAWLAHWLAAGADLADARAVSATTRYAVRAAAFSCERAGAAPLTADELAARD